VSRLQATDPLTAGQLDRYSMVRISTIMHVLHDAPGALATYWLGTARGDLLSPEGTQRKLELGEATRSGGMILSHSMRAQLALLEYLRSKYAGELGTWETSLLPLKERRLAQRNYDRRLNHLAEAGLLHRCVVGGNATLYFAPHRSGDDCEWANCPTGTFEPRSRASRHDAQSVTRGRSECHAMTVEPGTGTGEEESLVLPAALVSEGPSPDDASTRLLLRLEEGTEQLTPEQELERLALTMKTLGASRAS
jgi:hypothetical protein